MWKLGNFNIAQSRLAASEIPQAEPVWRTFCSVKEYATLKYDYIQMWDERQKN